MQGTRETGALGWLERGASAPVIVARIAVASAVV